MFSPRVAAVGVLVAPKLPLLLGTCAFPGLGLRDVCRSTLRLCTRTHPVCGGQAAQKIRVDSLTLTCIAGNNQALLIQSQTFMNRPLSWESCCRVFSLTDDLLQQGM